CRRRRPPPARRRRRGRPASGRTRTTRRRRPSARRPTRHGRRRPRSPRTRLPNVGAPRVPPCPTMSTDALHELDDDAIRLMAFRVWGYKQGEQVSLLIHLGDRLGLFRAMAGVGPLTVDELAARTELHVRWIREWLWAMAAAEL